MGKHDDFVVHACEQVLRFTNVANWDDLPEKIKVQLSFNMGVVALGLKLTKEEGYTALADASQGVISMQKLNQHMLSLIATHAVVVGEENINRAF